MGLRKKKSLVDQAIDQATDYVDALRPHVEAAYGQAKDFVQDTAIPALNDARDKAGPAIADAREKTAPLVAAGTTIAVEKATAARAKAAPLVAAGATVAAERAATAKGAADAQIAKIKGEEPKKKGKLKKVLLLGAIAGGAAVVAKKLQGGKQSDNWQSSYKPTPAPTSAPASTPAPTSVEDTAGASPDEAIADAAEAPHPVTTPDDPAEVVEVEPTKE